MTRTVRDIMTPDPVFIGETESVLEAARRLAQADVGSLPIVGDGHVVHGIVTDRDIVVKVLAEAEDPETTNAGALVMTMPVTVTPDTPLAEAQRAMSERQVRRLPVVEDGRLVGMLAQADLARSLEQERTGELVQDISQE